jgi:hypothetical protein
VRRQMVLFCSECWSAAPAGIRSFVVPVGTPIWLLKTKIQTKKATCRIHFLCLETPQIPHFTGVWLLYYSSLVRWNTLAIGVQSLH